MGLNAPKRIKAKLFREDTVEQIATKYKLISRYYLDEVMDSIHFTFISSKKWKMAKLLICGLSQSLTVYSTLGLAALLKYEVVKLQIRIQVQ